MIKKLATALLLIAICFVSASCRENEDIFVGEWVEGTDIYEGIKTEYSEGIMFNEDGSCDINGNTYTWQLSNEKNKDVEIYADNSIFADGYFMEKTDDYPYSRLILNLPAEKKGHIIEVGFTKLDEFTKVEITKDNWQDYFVESKRQSSTAIPYEFNKELGRVNKGLSDVVAEYRIGNERYSGPMETIGLNDYGLRLYSNIPEGQSFSIIDVKGALYYYEKN